MRLGHEEDGENYGLSLSKFESMLKTNKVFFFDAEEFEDIIFHYLDTGKNSLAKRALSLGLEQHPKSTGLKLLQVEMLIYDGKLELAEKYLEELYLVEPNNEELYIQHAHIYSKRNDHEKAIEVLTQALEYADDRSEIHSMIGMEYLCLDEYDSAKKYFILCLDEDPEDHTTLHNVMHCFDSFNQYEQAINYLEAFIDKNPFSRVAWHQLGRQYYNCEKYEKAVWAYDYAIVIDDTFVGAYMEKGKSLEKLKRYEEALESYQLTMELDDVTSFALLRAGKCYEKLGNIEQALKFYHKTVHEDPLLDKGWVAITDFYLRREDHNKALYYINKALSIDETNVKYWKRYAEINNNLENLDETEYGFRKAIEHGDTFPNTFMQWALALIGINEIGNAIDALLECDDLFPEESDIKYFLAGIYFMVDEHKKGAYHLTNALQLDSNGLKFLEALFPNIFELNIVQKIIEKHRKK